MAARTTLIAVLFVLAGTSPAQAAAPTSCGPGTPDEVMTGQFDSSRQGSFVLLPFEVPEETTQVRVRYCYDQPQPGGPQAGHTLDLGLYEPRRPGRDLWGLEEFRGWSGSGYDDVSVTPQGFSSRAQYLSDPKQHVPGRTTRSYRPGPIPDGEWAAELGLANIEPPPRDLDGNVAYRVEVLLDDDPDFADDPYDAPRYDDDAARSDAGWYAGDFHVHGEHSGDAEASMDETFDFAFDPPARGGVGLDFIALTDHNTDSAWPEIGRHQSDHPDNLVLRSQEVTTYRGHSNGHAGEQADYRTGPVLERESGGSLRQLRGPQPAGEFLEAVRDADGFTQINHPTIFPSPPFPSNLCRGCEWRYSDAETRYGEVDAIEIATGPGSLGGPGPNPFTVTAIEFWEDKLDAGHKIAAVGGSDDHRAGMPEQATQSAIGEPTTVVFAEELSEEGVRDAVRAGHSYVKVTGSDRPDLRFEAREPGSSAPAKIMGDTIRADEVEFEARVLDGGPGLGASGGSDGGYQLTVLKDGMTPVRTVPVTSDDFRLDFDSTGPGRYRLQLMRGQTIEAVSSPIYVEAGGGGEDPGGGSDGEDDGDGDSGGGGGETGSDGGGSGASSGGDGAAETGSGTATDTGLDSGSGTATPSDGAGALPLTGLALGGLLAAGAVLAGGGALLRRRAR